MTSYTLHVYFKKSNKCGLVIRLSGFMKVNRSIEFECFADANLKIDVTTS